MKKRVKKIENASTLFYCLEIVMKDLKANYKISHLLYKSGDSVKSYMIFALGTHVLFSFITVISVQFCFSGGYYLLPADWA